MKLMKCMLLTCAAILSTQSSLACTRILKNTHAPAVMVGRNMDWALPDRMKANLWVYPRGVERSGLTKNNPIHWRAKYGSIAATSFDQIVPVTSDGMNEHGLAAHLNSLRPSKYGTRHSAIPGLNVAMWAQYVLDNFKTVNEVVKAANSNEFQLVAFQVPHSKLKVNVHLGVEDASGDSAIIEYKDGVVQIYHNRAYTAMTNDPFYDVQLANLKNYRGLGGNQPLPGTSSPKDRFVRATYYAANLPKYTTVDEELTGVYSILENTGHVRSAITADNPTKTETDWRVVADLTNRVYYFSTMRSLNLIHVDLKKFNLSANNPKRRLIVQERKDLTGDVTNLLVPVTE